MTTNNIIQRTRQMYNHVDIPQRVVLSILGFLAIVNSYNMRHCLDVALTEIVAPKEKPEKFVNDLPNQKETLSDYGDKIGMKFRDAVRRSIRRFKSARTRYRNRAYIKPKVIKHNWSQRLQNIILSSYYVGYGLSQVPGGMLAERYGGKWVLCVGIGLAAFLTLLTPLIIRCGGPIGLILLRLLLGLSEGPTFPALSALLAKWVPSSERGKLGVFVLSAGQVGIFIVKMVAAVLLKQFDWPLIFYFFGFLALIWLVCFAVLCYSDPESSPFIKENEKEYLTANIRNISHHNMQLPPTPWRDIFKSAPMWALIIATVQYDWSQINTVRDVIKFLQDVKHKTLSESLYTGLNETLPNTLNWIVSLLSGTISDALVNRDILSVTLTRKVMTFIAAFGPNVVTSLNSCMECRQNTGLMGIFHCAMGIMGTYYAGVKITPLDMSPNYAGTIMGIANGLGSVTGIIAPYVEDVFLNNTLFNNLRALIWLASTALASGDLQPFNDPQPTTTTVMEKTK